MLTLNQLPITIVLLAGSVTRRRIGYVASIPRARYTVWRETGLPLPSS
jgi:hypothetical protein